VTTDIHTHTHPHTLGDAFSPVPSVDFWNWYQFPPDPLPPLSRILNTPLRSTISEMYVQLLMPQYICPGKTKRLHLAFIYRQLQGNPDQEQFTIQSGILTSKWQQ